jgi:hypothetical protein
MNPDIQRTCWMSGTFFDIRRSPKVQPPLFSKSVVSAKILLYMVLSGVTALPAAQAQSPQGGKKQTALAAQSASARIPRKRPPYAMPQGALDYYANIWGVDSLSVKFAESGEIIRFSYRVLDPVKAKVLNNKRNEPALIDPGAGVKLVVPKLEKIGQLRQSSTPIAGKVYWMAFSNKGTHVKPGHHVDVMIGQFRAENLIVQ